MSKSLNLFAGTVVGLGVMLTAAYNFADRNVATVPGKLTKLAPLTAVQLEELRAAEETAVVAQAPVGGLIAAANAQAGGAGAKYGLGRVALPEEVSAWDREVSPDGTGLPAGSGNAMDGESIFEENCAVCHGSFAEGVDNWPKLAGGFGTLADEDPLKTVGSYWPYLSTVWDYVHRSMPFGAAQTLSNDDVYAIVAYILYSNDLVEDDFELSKETWDQVALPNAGGFIVDDRAATEYSQWQTAEPCMENCKEGEVTITMRATVLDVTPDVEGADSAATDQAAAAPAVQDTTEVAATAVATAEEAVVEEAAPAAAAVDPELVAAGEKVFKKCKACHQVGDGAKNRTGPELNGVVGRAIGSVDGFKYSKSMSSMGGDWTEETLAAFLHDPKGYVKGTKMSFRGLKKDKDIAAVTAYLETFN